MKKPLKLAGAALVLALGLTLFACDDSEFTDESTSSEYSEDEGEEIADSDDAKEEDAVADIDVTTRCGLQVGKAEGNLDENPTRKVRRSVKNIGQTVGTKLDGSALPQDFYMYRSVLNNSYKKAYDEICAALSKGEPVIEMSTPVPVNDVYNVYFSVVYDHPEFFWVACDLSYAYNNNYVVTTITPKYFEGSPSAYTQEIEQCTSEPLADMWSLEYDIDKVKYAHDYLINHITYTKNDLDQSAYSGFSWGKTVCAGYSKCFEYMMHKMGIPCATVVGDVYAGAHAWNLVLIDNEYYLLDCTWDDHENGTYDYKYFNITDAQIASDHTRGTEGLNISTFLPAANGTYYSYSNFYGGNAPGTNFDAINGQMPQLVSNNGGNTNQNDDYGYDDNNGYDDDDYADDDYYDNYYTYDDYDDEDYGWWNMLEPSWTKDDWTWYDEGQYWYIYDENSYSTYVYKEDDDQFAVYDNGSETWYYLNYSTGEWEEY